MHAEVLTTTGAEELEIECREDRTVELASLGEDAGVSGGNLANFGNPGECSDPEYTHGERRVLEDSTPSRGCPGRDLQPGHSRARLR